MADQKNSRQLIYTIRDRCRMCYTCVRECPAKAIRIEKGQAIVIHERCIACGNCVKVCNQNAKKFLDTRAGVEEILKSDRTKIALVAPSFPAEFTEWDDHRMLVGMIRALGFDRVMEVSFGADMVAREYNKLLSEEDSPKQFISSDCPAIVKFISYYHPDLVENLAPIVSPMVATARIARHKFGSKSLLVFIGPCIAKKAESSEIDEALTFRELRSMFVDHNLNPSKIHLTEFDAPHSGKGAIFPLSRGLLQTANWKDDICEGGILVAEGKENFREALREFESGSMATQNLELLCCDGCIMGPGMSVCGRKFERTVKVSNYAQKKMNNLDVTEWKEQVAKYQHLDFSQKFTKEDKRLVRIPEQAVEDVLKSMGKFSEKDHLDCGACGYATCREHAMAIVEGLAENEMCLPYTIEKLHKSIDELNISNEKLANAQQALRQSEKLASMGQLSAGIAHELNNPLGVITMYCNILKDETPADHPMRKDLELIVEQTARCKNIVGGLLNFARKNQVHLLETNLAEFIQRSLNSVIHGENVNIIFEDRSEFKTGMIDQDQMMQVFTNLEKNAVEAMPDGGELKVVLAGTREEVEISFTDTGTGIAEENMDKLFTPFFTTKEVGKGTGLGLPLVYGIVKMHRGKIVVKSNTDPAKGPTGSVFTVIIPR